MKTILLLTDFSSSARKAANLAVIIAAQMQANITLHCIHPGVMQVPAGDMAFGDMDDMPDELDNDELLEKERQRLQYLIRNLPLRVPRPGLNSHIPGTTLPEYFNDKSKQGVMMVVMGAAEKTKNDFFYGDDIEQVEQLANCPLLVVPDAWVPTQQIKNIVFTTDLAETDLKAVAWVKRLAGGFNANMHVGHVSRPSFNMDSDDEERIGIFMAGMRRMQFHYHDFQNLTGKNVVLQIEEFTKNKHADILAMVHKKHSIIWQMFNHSITSETLMHQRVPLLIIPEGDLE